MIFSTKRIASAALAAGAALSSAACSSQIIGEQSCRASARGACPEVSNMTLFVRRSGTISYYHPDGTIYSLESVQVRRGTWWVDESGTKYLRRWPNSAVTEWPVSRFAEGDEVFPGDPAGVTLNGRGYPLGTESKLPFAEIARQVRAR
jgi:hypothetical protein